LIGVVANAVAIAVQRFKRIKREGIVKYDAIVAQTRSKPV
jgi:hypothetical protein